MANESINLNLIPNGEMPVIHVSQFDNGRQFNINLLKGSDEYTLPAGYTAVLNCRKADRNIVTLATTSVLSNTLTFTTTTQLCACSGKNICEVVIKDAEDFNVGTLNFILRVERDPLQGGIESTSEIHDLEDQIEDITTEIISENYYTKTETDTLLDAKADAADLALVATTGSYNDLNNLPKLNGMTITGNKTAQWYGLASKLNDLSDVSLSLELSEFDTLIYNSYFNKWINSKMSYTWLADQPSIPDAQVQSDYAQSDNTQVDYIKNKPDLSVYAKESDLILATGTENETPYQIRQAPSNIGNMALEKLVGVSCVFNQLVQNGNFESTTGWLTRDGATITANDNVGTVSFSSASLSAVKRPISMVQNHVYLIQASVKGSDGKNVYFALTNNGGSPIAPQKTITPTADWSVVSVLNKMTQTVSNDADLNCVMFRNASGEANTIDIKEVEVIDLTAMFGSEVADYLYTLESGTAGSGVALFKSLFGDGYYPYTANTLMSAKPTGKVIKDENDQTIETIVYSGNELRGLLKVGTNGLYADGDIDDGSGTETVRYGIVDLGSLNWVYDSGVPRFYSTDLSTVIKKPTDNNIPANVICSKYPTANGNAVFATSDFIVAISTGGAVNIKDSNYTSKSAFETAMDGVYLIYELATPTTQTSSAWTNPIVAKEGGTEEFTDNRIIKMPTGHDTIYSKKTNYRYWG